MTVPCPGFDTFSTGIANPSKLEENSLKVWRKADPSMACRYIGLAPSSECLVHYSFKSSLRY